MKALWAALSVMGIWFLLDHADARQARLRRLPGQLDELTHKLQDAWADHHTRA